jgi:hypothetical protein
MSTAKADDTATTEGDRKVYRLRVAQPMCWWLEHIAGSHRVAPERIAEQLLERAIRQAWEARRDDQREG